MKPLEEKELQELLRTKLAEERPVVSDDHWEAIAQRLPKGQLSGRLLTGATIVVILAIALWSTSGPPSPPVADKAGAGGEAPVVSSDIAQAFKGYPIEPTSQGPPPGSASLKPTNEEFGPANVRPMLPLSIADSASGRSIIAKRQSLSVGGHSSVGVIDLDYAPKVVTVPSSGSEVGDRRFDLRPKLINGEVQAYYHTLNPFLEDENRLQPAPTAPPFLHRTSLAINAGYASQLSFLRLEYGLGVDFLSSEMRFSIANAPDESEQRIRNLRINLGLWTSVVVDARQWQLPGYLEGNLTWKYGVWKSSSEENAYDPSVLQYHLRYGLFLKDRTTAYFGYGSFVQAEHLPDLGRLRPHIYSVGIKQYLR